MAIASPCGCAAGLQVRRVACMDYVLPSAACTLHVHCVCAARALYVHCTHDDTCHAHTGAMAYMTPLRRTVAMRPVRASFLLMWRLQP